MGILVGCQFYMIQKSFAQFEKLKADANRLKAEVNFEKWSGKNEPRRVAPVLLNLFRFPTITNKSPFTRKSLAGRVLIRANVERTLHHEYILSDRQEKNRLEINLLIAPSSTEAHEYIIWRFVNNSLPHALRVKDATPTRELRIGHLCFANVKNSTDRIVSIRFIRNNIIVEIIAEGEKFQKETRGIAETIDYLLLKEKTGEDAAAYYNQELQRLSENERRGIREKITREGP
jgi:hypothetical protein